MDAQLRLEDEHEKINDKNKEIMQRDQKIVCLERDLRISNSKLSSAENKITQITAAS
jgi:hypothetical protein